MKRSWKSRVAFLRWAASIAIAWPVLSGVLCPPHSPGGVLVHDRTALYFLPRDSCFPRTPTATELLQSRHRVVVAQPDGRIAS